VIKYFSSGEGLRETYLAGSGPEGLTTFGMWVRMKKKKEVAPKVVRKFLDCLGGIRNNDESI
jgi:hypothetical protein